jgi:hypothetical protein
LIGFAGPYHHFQKNFLKPLFGGVISARNKKCPGRVKKNGTTALTKVKPM